MAQQRLEQEPASPSAAAQAKRPQFLSRLLEFLRTMGTLFLLVLAIALLGLTPVALSGTFFGYWHLPFLPSPAQSTSTQVTSALALPRHSWAAVSVTVYDQPGATKGVATLDPGYPVTLIEQRRVGSANWVHIHWGGPTTTSGGEGWALSSAFASAGGGTASIGDLGAFSPALARALSSQSAHMAVALYFPDAGYLYRLNADQPFALGDGFRGPLLVATLSQAEAAHPPTSVPQATLTQIANGDSVAASIAYTQLGGASGVTGFLASLGVSVTELPTTDWTTGQAPAASVLAFYNALLSGRVLSESDRALALNLLGHSDSAVVSAVGGANPLNGAGPLIASIKQHASGWTISSVGIATPSSGPKYIVVAVAHDVPTQAVAQQDLAAFFQQLAPLVRAT